MVVVRQVRSVDNIVFLRVVRPKVLFCLFVVVDIVIHAVHYAVVGRGVDVYFCGVGEKSAPEGPRRDG